MYAQAKLFEFPQAVPGTVDTGDVFFPVTTWQDKGYDFVRDAGAGFTAVLEGSVSGRNWTSITALGASGQGTINAHFNHVRLHITVAGALGATTALMVCGKEP